jgi:ribosome-associated translation inhibitor RaiA
MIKKIEISGINFDVDKDLQKYVTNKIRKIEHYIPNNSRKNIHVEVKLKEDFDINKVIYQIDMENFSQDLEDSGICIKVVEGY